MIIGLGNDIIDIRRIEKTIDRFGDRFLQRIFTETERLKSDRRAPASGVLRETFCGEGSLREGARYGLSPGRLLA